MKHPLRALTIAILAFAGCDDTSEAVGRPAGESSAPTRSDATADRRNRCADPGAFTVDVDNDGRVDRVYHLYLHDESRGVLGVCTASGVHDEIEAEAPEANALMDLEPDGRDEILFGGTTVSAVVLSIAVVHDGRLHEVEFPGSVSLVSGITQRSEGSWTSES